MSSRDEWVVTKEPEIHDRFPTKFLKAYDMNSQHDGNIVDWTTRIEWAIHFQDQDFPWALIRCFDHFGYHPLSLYSREQIDIMQHLQQMPLMIARTPRKLLTSSSARRWWTGAGWTGKEYGALQFANMGDKASRERVIKAGEAVVVQDLGADDFVYQVVTKTMLIHNLNVVRPVAVDAGTSKMSTAFYVIKQCPHDGGPHGELYWCATLDATGGYLGGSWTSLAGACLRYGVTQEEYRKAQEARSRLAKLHGHENFVVEGIADHVGE